MSALTRLFNKQREKYDNQNEKQSKLYKIITSISIFGIFAACAIIVFAITGYIKMSSFIFGVIASIFIVCAGCLLILPWVRSYDKYKFKKTAIIFMIAIGICVLLWLVCLFIGIDIYNKSKAISEIDSGYLLMMLNIVKYTLIISIQILVASFIAQTIIKYQKSMIAFQVITYASYLFSDFYITFLLSCLKLSSAGFEISQNISFLLNKLVLTILALSVIFAAISNGIIKRMDARKLNNAI